MTYEWYIKKDAYEQNVDEIPVSHATETDILNGTIVKWSVDSSWST